MWRSVQLPYLGDQLSHLRRRRLKLVGVVMAHPAEPVPDPLGPRAHVGVVQRVEHRQLGRRRRPDDGGDRPRTLFVQPVLECAARHHRCHPRRPRTQRKRSVEQVIGVVEQGGAIGHFTVLARSATAVLVAFTAALKSSKPSCTPLFATFSASLRADQLPSHASSAVSSPPSASVNRARIFFASSHAASASILDAPAVNVRAEYTSQAVYSSASRQRCGIARRLTSSGTASS